jgi:hypothetical protein
MRACFIRFTPNDRRASAVHRYFSHRAGQFRPILGHGPSLPEYCSLRRVYTAYSRINYKAEENGNERSSAGCTYNGNTHDVFDGRDRAKSASKVGTPAAPGAFGYVDRVAGRGEVPMRNAFRAEARV